MTIEDAYIIVGGSVALLVTFLVAGYFMRGGTVRHILIMSRQVLGWPPADGMQLVYIPVSQYSMDAGGMDEDEDDAPDIEAADADMPRVSRNITDSEMVVLLAAQRGKDGKPRYSANAIHTLVGGDRNAVLARIKELRAVAPPPEYMRPDGTKAPATYPVTGKRTHA